MTPITEIYSGATYFGVPLRPYFGAYVLMMCMYLLPTLIALGWALTEGQRRVSILRLVRPSRPFDRPLEGAVDRTGQPISIEEERIQRTDRAA